jgi:predicted transcriptional regulator
MSDPKDQDVSLSLVTEIVSAFVSNSSVSNKQIPDLITSVHQTLMKVTGQAPEILKPAVPKKRSVTPDYIVCLEDGKRLKMLKRHIRNSYNLSPEEYRKKWGLPNDYPMVAPKYAAQRSELAKKIGLGKSRRKGRKKAAA